MALNLLNSYHPTHRSIPWHMNTHLTQLTQALPAHNLAPSAAKADAGSLYSPSWPCSNSTSRPNAAGGRAGGSGRRWLAAAARLDSASGRAWRRAGGPRVGTSSDRQLLRQNAHGHTDAQRSSRQDIAIWVRNGGSCHAHTIAHGCQGWIQQQLPWWRQTWLEGRT